MAKNDIHKYIAVFLIIIGILPFIGVGISGIISNVVHILTIASGIVILLTK